MSSPSFARLFFIGVDYPRALVDLFVPVFARDLPTDVDTPALVRLFLGSYSLELTEKHRVIERLRLLDKDRCTQLQKVWTSESDNTENLALEHPRDLAALSARAWLTNNMLANYLGLPWSAAQEQSALLEMLRRKYKPRQRSQLRQWLSVGQPGMAAYVFGPALAVLQAGGRATPVPLPTKGVRVPHFF